MEGLTGKLRALNGHGIGGEVVVPSEILKVQGPVPVKFKATVVDDPLQIVVVPEIVAVGLGFTVMLIGDAESVLKGAPSGAKKYEKF